MKLARYHKNKRNLVKMLHTYDFDHYSKIIVRKDYEDDNYPPEIFNNPKTEKGGLVFSNGKYIPMESEIEVLVGDSLIYEEMGRYYNARNDQKNMFKTQMRATHLRMSLEKNALWSNWKSQVKQVNPGRITNFIIHDKDIHLTPEVPNILYEYFNTLHQEGRRIAMKHPLQIHSSETFLNWMKHRRLSNLLTVDAHIILDDNVITSAGKDTGFTFRYIIPSSKWDLKTQVQVFKQAIFLGVHKVKTLLILTGEDLNSTEIKLIELFNDYFAFRAKNYRYHKSLHFYARYLSSWLKVDLLEIFEYVRQNNYDLFKLFYECSLVELNNNGDFQSTFIWKPHGGR